MVTTEFEPFDNQTPHLYNQRILIRERRNPIARQSNGET